MQPTEKISALPPKSTLDPTDLFAVVDTSTNTTKKVTGAALSLAFSSATNGWQNLNFTPTFVSNDGNKQVTLQVSGANLTSVLSPGMKFKATRGTTPATTCMAFTAASSQYAQNTSPTGLTFTSAFTIETWVYLNSYTTAANVGFVSRHNGTNGFILGLNTFGRLCLFNGSASNQMANQTLPLKRWLHVAATFSSGTMNLYLNGALIPSTTSGSGSAITQAGSLQLGAYASGQFLDGYLAESRIWNSALSQSTIQSNMGLSLTTASGLVFNAPGAGNFNDVSGVGNNLTAVNSAIATQAANPANATEYAFITSVTYSSPNTTIKLFTGTDCNIPNMTLSNVQYSLTDAPFGFPKSRGKWCHDYINIGRTSISAPSASSWYNAGDYFTVPTGDWDLGYRGTFAATAASGGFLGVRTSLGTTSSTELNWVYRAITELDSPASTETDGQAGAEYPYTATTPSTIYMLGQTQTSSATIYFGSSSSVLYMYAQCAYA